MDGSTLRGVQVLRTVGDRDDQLAKLLGEDPERTRSVSFLVADRQGGRMREWPPVPRENRKTPASERPPRPITPTFFRGEVLSRFKRHPKKYALTQTSIDCRSAWYLRSYDVNEAGQVYAYLKDLWALPFREQLYWRAFNEAPKAGLSERSIAQDFEVRYWEGPDPLRDLTAVLVHFPSATQDGQPAAIWTAGPEEPRRALAALHYVVTDSPKDWADEVLELAKVVVEGLKAKALKRVARAHGCPEAELQNVGSIRLLRAVLLAKRVEEDIVEIVHEPLLQLNQLRSQAGVAHRGASLPRGDLRQHHRRLLADVAGAMGRLADLVRQGIFDLPVSYPKSGAVNATARARDVPPASLPP